MKEYFKVLNVSRDDLKNVVNIRNKKLLRKIHSLSDKEMNHVAEEVSEFIYDGDVWDDACRYVISEVLK